MRLPVLVLLLVAPSCSKKAAEEDTANYCHDELVAVGGAFEASLADGTPEARGAAFHATMERFEKGTMCGPDAAALARDWEAELRAPDPARHRELLVQLGALAIEGEWTPPAALAKAIETARAGK